MKKYNDLEKFNFNRIFFACKRSHLVMACGRCGPIWTPWLGISCPVQIGPHHPHVVTRCGLLLKNTQFQIAHTERLELERRGRRRYRGRRWRHQDGPHSHRVRCGDRGHRPSCYRGHRSHYDVLRTRRYRLRRHIVSTQRGSTSEYKQ